MPETIFQKTTSIGRITMPLRPQVVKFHCPACGWKTITQPRSDALLDGTNTFRACPRCGSAELETQVLSGVEAAMAKIGKGLESLFPGKTSK